MKDASPPAGSPSPSAAHVPGVHVVPASLGRRFAALAYEALLLAALVLATGFLLAPALTPATQSSGYGLRVPTPATRVLLFAAQFGVGALYFGWSWTGGRRTLAQKTWRLSLVRADGTRVAARAALVRYLAAWIGPACALAGYLAPRPVGLAHWAVLLLPANFAWALVDADGAFLHDRIAGTRIVRDPST